MARVTGPLMSMDASGQLGGAMVFSKWKGRPYVRQLVIPSNPKSPAQTATRAMMAFLSQAWKDIAEIDQATWEVGADQKKISAFNHYTSYNMSKWTQFLSPSEMFPETGDAYTGTPGEVTAVGGVRQATIQSLFGDAGNGWGLILYGNLGSAPTGIKQEVMLISNCAGISGGDPVTQIVTGLDPGTWHFKTQAFSVAGSFGTISSDETAVVT